MTSYRHTSLFNLHPVVDFSFTAKGCIYSLVRRSASERKGKTTLTLRKKGERTLLKRHYCFEQLRTTFVFLHDDPRTSRQPKMNVSYTYLSF